jgi:hypothetical protein
MVGIRHSSLFAPRGGRSCALLAVAFAVSAQAVSAPPATSKDAAPPAPMTMPPAPPPIMVPPPPPRPPAPSPVPYTPYVRKPIEPSDQKLRVEASENGQVIYIIGSLDLGSFTKVKRVFDKNPSAKTLYLASEGGLVLEGATIGHFIRKRAIATYVDHYCASSCTAIFAAGAVRGIAPGARIGFHKSYSAKSNFLVPGQPRNQLGDTILRQSYVHANVDRAFIDKALATTSSSMWYPTDAELLASRFVTQVAVQPNLSLLKPKDATYGAIESFLLEKPFWKSVKQANPSLFASVTDMTWQNMMLSGSVDVIDLVASNQLRKQIFGLVPTLPDASLRLIIDALYDGVKRSSETMNGKCRGIESAFTMFDSKSDSLSKEDQSLFLSLLTAKQIATTLSEQEAQEAIAGFAVALGASGETSLGDPGSLGPYVANSCAFAQRMFSAIKEMPGAEGPQTLRAMFWVFDNPSKVSTLFAGF